MYNLLLIIISGVLSAFFGWAGGRGDDFWREHKNWPRWMFQSWMRDWNIGWLCVLTAFLLGVHNPWILLVIPITGGALSTYWDFLYKDQDNFWVHGFFVGLAALPIAYATGHWWIFLARSILLAIWMGVWSKIFGNVHMEESGRYAPVAPSLFFLC